MRQYLTGSGLAALMTFAAVPAFSDIPPPPGEQHRQLMAAIAGAGYECPDSREVTAASELSALSGRIGRISATGRNVTVIRCGNGRRFIVGLPPRQPSNPMARRTDLPDTPVAEPVE